MLIGFKVKNFRSFNELQHFSMVAGKTRNFPNHIVEKSNVKLLKFSAVYGANASGKSNLILAIDLGKRVLLNGIEELFSNQYFRINEKCKSEPSYFEYEIEKNNKLYSYGFEINIDKKEIISEWLIDMTKSKPKIIFERDIINNTIESDLKFPNKEDKNRFQVYKDDISNNNKIFFLSEFTRRILMTENKKNEFFKDFIDVYQFFRNNLQIILPNQHKAIQVNYFSKYKDNIKKLLKNLGLDIRDLVELKSSMLDIKESLPNDDYIMLSNEIKQMQDETTGFSGSIRIGNCIYTINWKLDYDEIKVNAIKLLHNHSDVYFDTYEESDGTLRILELIDILLSKDKVFIIDEIDRSLHPSLTAKFIQCFLNMVKEKNVQLLITTHESGLLNYDILRRDEIWFSEKNEKGETKLYSLEQFKEDARFDRRIDKAYLDGRYGAIPIFQNEVNNENTNS